MLNSETESGNRSIMKFAAAAAAMVALAGCAIAVPLPPLATSFQESRDGHFACKAGSKCSNETTNHRVAYRHSQPVGGGQIDDDPPDFILNRGDQDGTPATRAQME
jgi:hypothetical protein